jgi:LPS export ABC transporter protein LptC
MLACKLPLQAPHSVLKFSMRKMLFLLAGICLLTITFYHFQDSDFRPKYQLSDNSYMENVNIIQKKAGETRLVVNAEKAIFETDTDVKLLVMDLYFPEKGLTLTSDTGHYNTKTRDVVIEGNIKAKTKGYDLVTDKLHWDAAKSELISDDKVVIAGKGGSFYMEGDTLTAHGDKATLRKNVKAIFKGK